MTNYDQPEYPEISGAGVPSPSKSPAVKAVVRVREGFDKVGILRREDMSTPDLLK